MYQTLSFNVSDPGGIKEVILQLHNGANVILTGNPHYSYSWIQNTAGNISISLYITDKSNNTKVLTLNFIVYEDSEIIWYWYLIFTVVGVVGVVGVVFFSRYRKTLKRRNIQRSFIEPEILKKIDSVVESKYLMKSDTQKEEIEVEKRHTIISTIFELISIVPFIQKLQIIGQNLEKYTRMLGLDNLMLFNFACIELGKFFHSKESGDLLDRLTAQNNIEMLTAYNIEMIAEEDDPVVVEFDELYFSAHSFELEGKLLIISSMHNDPTI